MSEPRGAYPTHLVQRVRLRDGSAVTIRPIRPEDAALEIAFVHGLSDEARYFRFHDSLRDLTPKMLSQFTVVDYHDHLALIAVSDSGPAPKRGPEDKQTMMLRPAANNTPTTPTHATDDKPHQIGVARYVVEPGGETCEFAIVVADAWQGLGLATLLMQALMAAARARGVRRMHGDVLAANHKMLALTGKLGFRNDAHPDDPRMRIVDREL
jgi:acetyltransferase